MTMRRYLSELCPGLDLTGDDKFFKRYKTAFEPKKRACWSVCLLPRILANNKSFMLKINKPELVDKGSFAIAFQNGIYPWTTCPGGTNTMQPDRWRTFGVDALVNTLLLLTINSGCCGLIIDASTANCPPPDKDQNNSTRHEARGEDGKCISFVPIGD